ncbi:hypothetical protein AVEN_150493-1 [Araneus ventricosus]|uniref:Uncharacterized protein n=1 Tax=Araneus ventricosus TaxID=182803 RepID=A0A4Y2H966_ARAVE|nr:hypothetical protein AVEN_150493-1 [Araneus ventricosus]
MLPVQSFNSLIPKRHFPSSPFFKAFLEGYDMNCTLPTWLVIYHPTPCYNLPLRRTEMGCGWQGQLVPLWLLSPKRNPNLPSKEANRLRPAIVAVKGTFLDRPRPHRSVSEG